MNETYWVMYCSITCGSISGGYVTEPWASDATLGVYIEDDARHQGLIPLPPGMNGVWGGIWTFGPTIPACTVLYDGITFRCESDLQACQDTVITLQEVTEYPELYLGEVYDTVVIHQIPEPASMLLLGLGGLFLCRRK